jgi:glucokinase
MAKNSRYAIGVDLGGTNIKFGLVAENGEIEKKLSLQTKAEDGPEAVVSQIKKGITELLNKNIKIEGIGIGSPGIVSAKKGIVENPPNLPGWKKVHLSKIIKKEFGYVTYIENDANAAAIGEKIFGSGAEYRSFIMITLGTGVGGGIIMRNKLFRGEFGAAGEVGHLSIDMNGPACNCGSYGCIETYIGNSYLTSWVREELKSNPSSNLHEILNNDLSKLTPKLIKEAMEAGDSFSENVVKKMGFYLGCALASLSNLLDVSVFIIGGGVSGFGKPLFIEIERVIKERVLNPLRERVKVLPAKLKNDAGVKGASALVFFRS